jgi:hypothetical protein
MSMQRTSFRAWIASLFTADDRRQSRGRPQRRQQFRPWLECLEDRLAPAFTLLVDARGATAGVTATVNGGTTTFTASASGAHLNVNDIVTALQSGDVVVDSGSTGSQAGDITINAGITNPTTAPNTLTFQTGSGAGVVGNITVNADLVPLNGGATGGALPLSLLAGNNLVLNGTLNSGATSITLTATKGAISQTSGLVAIASELSLTSGTGIGTASSPLLLSGITNLQALDGTGGVFLQTDGTNIGFGDTTPGIQVTGSGDISVTGSTLGVSNTVAGPGNLTIESSLGIAAGGVVVVESGASVTTTGTAATVTLAAGSVDILANASVSTGSGGSVVVNADSLSLGGTISTGSSGSVSLAPFSSGMPVDLGGNGSGTSLVVTQADLNQITTAVVQVGDTFRTSSLSVTAAISVSSPVTTLGLLSGGDVSQTVSGTALSAASLEVTAGGGIGSSSQPLTFSAATLTANSSASNADQFLGSAGTTQLSSPDALDAGSGTITLAGGT